jgi:plastocyanin
MQFSTLLLAAFAAVTQGTYTCYSYLSDAVLEPVLTHPLAVDVQVVSVGQNPMAGMAGQPALKYYPDNIKAAPGSMVQFQFWAGNHTVTQSDFDHPCTPIHQVNSSIAGIWSSYMPVAAGASKKEIPVFTVMINDTKPIWIYCSQGKHCSAGMSMVINEK